MLVIKIKIINLWGILTPIDSPFNKNHGIHEYKSNSHENNLWNEFKDKIKWLSEVNSIEPF